MFKPFFLCLLAAASMGMLAEASDFYYTTFSSVSPHTQVNWVTCGSGSEGSGCFGSGNIGKFGRACAVAASNAHVFVMDVGMGNTTDLYIYEQNESSKPTILLERKHSFEITGGDDAQCHMAVFGDFVYLGTNVSSQYAQMNYKTLTTLTTMMCSSSTNTSSITASDKMVVVSQQGPSGPGCMAAFNEKGQTQLSGGEFADTFVISNNAVLL